MIVLMSLMVKLLCKSELPIPLKKKDASIGHILFSFVFPSLFVIFRHKDYSYCIIGQLVLIDDGNIGFSEHTHCRT